MSCVDRSSSDPQSEAAPASASADSAQLADSARAAGEVLRVVPGCSTRADSRAEQAAQIHAELTNLTGPQMAAIELLVSGKPDRTVAEQVGVHYKTVMRWRLYHAGFRAELSRRRQELWGAAADRFRLLLDRTLDVLTKQLGAENEATAFRAARALLLMARVFRPPDDPIDPERVLDQHARVVKRAWKTDDPMYEAVHADERAEAGHDLLRKLHAGEHEEASKS